ncbi:STN domain-containing protein [Caulobacter soli]|uniref:STN domain-containing protein n=1 Tax=Caulobacter soli TaxID=2708539 RepID=UPI0013EB97A7|nr:STN domain-containing protein [Caulobacter soli]
MPTRATARPPSASDGRRPAPAAPRAGWRPALAVGAWLLLAPAVSLAQAPVPVAPREAPIRFDISARPLSAAIEAYALATGVQVLYDRPRGEGLRSPGVVGLYTREAALRALLAGTGLAAVFSHDDSVVLRPDVGKAPPADFGPAPSDRSTMLSLDTLEVRGEAAVPAAEGERLDLKLYGGLVRGAVHQALAGDRDLAAGRYRLTLKLWIAPSGAIDRLVAEDSTGDPDRDQAITTIVGRVVIDSPPPEGLPQPVVLVVRSRPGA